MKILIYGAGVIGCELAHRLIIAGNDVTLLARGEWKETLERKGLVIRHAAQFRTTRDRPTVIGELPENKEYDLVFVAMQYSQLPAVLPIVGKNKSRRVVLIGNNLDADSTAATIRGYDPHKEIAFGFQGTGGRRENGKVVSVHLKIGMTVGEAHAQLEGPFLDCLTRAFAGITYRLTHESDMDAWLKCHAALVLPMAYVCYAVDCRLPRASKLLLNQSIDATVEAFALLSRLGYPIRPDGTEEYFRDKRAKWYRTLRVLAKTPLGRLAASDHCRHAVTEMSALDEAFEAMRSRTDTPMPAWEALRKIGHPHEVASR